MAYEEGFSLDPDTALAQNGFGLVRMVMGQYSDALSFFDRALAKDRKFAQAYANRHVAESC